ncbi:unnamed protein product [Trichobilharzia regenti]|nr:unnamed protein product [Trichobilharzia regenti]
MSDAGSNLKRDMSSSSVADTPCYLVVCVCQLAQSRGGRVSVTDCPKPSKCFSTGSTTSGGSGSTTSSSTVSGVSNSSVVLRQFEAHKAILSARSLVFAAMFEYGVEESRANRVEITDMEPDTVAEVLRYIYTRQVVGMDLLAHELLTAADKYQSERLKIMCEEALVESLSVENACDIFGLADMHNAERLKAHTLEFTMLRVRHRPCLLNECFRSLASQQLPSGCWARKHPRQSCVCVCVQ